MIARATPGTYSNPVRFAPINREKSLKKVEEYLEHAAECRAMAHATNIAEQREQLQEMARTWESLAEARQRDLNKKSVR